ncbi:MAG: PAS domain S-box protein [Candidatus Aminicenantes bacterium]|nr:PAS domain S-box protein [Candidatus Aminicenantes bacterium]NIM82591.1 PAS domain S-box protein [Candidatus Aminicenantes bacterium]NIN22178.1 PAS domain S-box protein [Candidatus Aminicenantes bacterium]NIN45938.1 PAS domain S-box protein [Candidatus Aminicenantes bacterium]NIN88774.1 PAS domain S-box protein [Candidatus Aminicenantes bacterium]
MPITQVEEFETKTTEELINQLEKIRGQLAEHEKAETEYKQKLEILKESEKRYRNLIEKQGEGIGIVDPRKQFIYANPAVEHILGVEPDQLVGRSLKEFVEPKDFNSLLKQTGKRRQGEVSVYEYDFIRPDRERRHVLITATPYFDEQKQFKGTFTIFRDITERKRVEKDLAEQKRIYQNLFFFEKKISHLDSPGVVHSAIQFIQAEMNAYRVSIALLEEDQSGFRVYDATMYVEGLHKGSFVPHGISYLSEVVQHKRPLYRADIRKIKTKNKIEKKLIKAGIISDFLVPLIVEDECIGTLNCGSLQVDGIPEEKRNMLKRRSQNWKSSSNMLRKWKPSVHWLVELPMTLIIY